MDELSSIAVNNAVAATALALLAVAISAVYRRPALVHGLWLLVLLKLVTPPLVFLPVAWPNTAELPLPEAAQGAEEPSAASQPDALEPVAPVVAFQGDGEAAAEVEAPPIVEMSPRPALAAHLEPFEWPQLLRMIWAVGALAWFFVALERLHHFRRLLRFARPASAALQERTRRLARSLGLRRCPRVRLLPGRIAPMLWAVGGPPRLLVPADLLPVLNDDQLDTLLLHELAHLRRRDHWVRILEFMVMGLYWWHPVVWYARRELREAEEQCCDAWVVSTLPGTGRTYASALLDTLDFLSLAQTAVPPLASGLSQIADLKRRLTMIMRGNTPRSLTWPGCLAVVAFGLTVLPMLPSLHGQTPSRDEQGRGAVDEQEAKRALDAAKADLQRLHADLEVKRAELAEAEARLKKAELARAEAGVKAAKARADIDRQKTLQESKLQYQKSIAQVRLNRGAITRTTLLDFEGKNQGNSRIIIVFSGDDIGNPKDIIKKIDQALPENLRGKMRITLEGGKQSPPVARNPTKSSETRINELELRLERVLRELQDLRKQMKQPRPEHAPTPPPAQINNRRNNRPVSPRGATPPVPPAPGAAPPVPSGLTLPAQPPAAAPPPAPGGAAPEPPATPPPVDPSRP